MSSGLASVGTSNRWDSTIWKASPARMCSFAISTMRGSPRPRSVAAGGTSAAGASNDGSDRQRPRLRQPVGHGGQPADRIVVRLVDPLVAAVPVHRVGDQGDGALVVVERGQVGGQQHDEFGDVQLVHRTAGARSARAGGRRRSRGSRPSRRSAAADRQRLGVQLSQGGRQRLERVTVGRQPGRRGARASAPDAVALGQRGRSGPDERPPRPGLAVLGRLQQEGARPVRRRGSRTGRPGSACRRAGSGRPG